MPSPPRHPPCPTGKPKATRHHGTCTLPEASEVKLRTLAGIALLLLGALSARSQEPPQEPARFLIETITVEGTKEAAANIIRAETLLEKGKTYSEDQLRQAVYRVHRLPFVLDASFALRKGSRRGAYELVIEVQTARWFFFDDWIRAFRFNQPLDLEDSFRTDESMKSSLDLGGLLGARLFVGRSGVLFAALDSEEGAQIGFTRYDLFHRGILVSAGYSRDTCCIREVLPLTLDPDFASWSFNSSQKVSLSVSVPLGGPQSIQLSASERTGDHGIRHEVLFQQDGGRRNGRFLDASDLSYRRAEAKWVWDTSDDPLVPHRGLAVSAGLEASRFATRNAALFEAASAGPFVTFGSSSPRSEQVAAAVSAIKYWPLSPRQTLSAQTRVSAGRSRLDDVDDQGGLSHRSLKSYSGSAGVGYAFTLRRSRTPGELSDLRLESNIEAGAEKVLTRNPLQRFSISTGLVFRNAWGRVRLLLTYLNLARERP